MTIFIALRKKKILGILFVAVLLIVFAERANAASVLKTIQEIIAPVSIAENEEYKAIVKINSFVLDKDFNLSLNSSGSGILISDSGLILTNNHVVSTENSLDNSNVYLGYQVCLSESAADEPDCSYTASLISKNKDLDAALLQIVNIPGLGDKISFPFLELNQVDDFDINSDVTAIGYPGIGGDTITVTKGIVSGKTEKYGTKWIKTDALISFGSSGGAIIDKNQKVIGISTKGHSDLLGGLGYAINITSINQWIADNKNNPAQFDKLLTDKAIVFSKKEKSIKTSNLFENDKPYFAIAKPQDWTYVYVKENTIFAYREGDDSSGYVKVYLEKYPYPVNTGNISPHIKNKALAENGDLAFLDIIESENVKISGRSAKKMLISNSLSSTSFYAVPFRNYLIFIQYDYGAGDKDKTPVDAMINSFYLKSDSSKFTKTKKFTNSSPNFSLNVGKDWSILKNNSRVNPIIVLNDKIKDAYVSITVSKRNEKYKKFSNKQLLSAYKKQIEKINKLSALLDTKFEITESGANHSINDNVKGAIKINIAVKTPSNNKTIGYKADYSKKINSQYDADIILISTNPDKKSFDKAMKEFDKMLKGFSLTSSKDSDKDGLTDEQEKKYGTNPKKADTDGDGYLDGVEVKNGYNPKGSGKLN